MVNTSFNCICSVHCQLIDFAFLSPANPKCVAFFFLRIKYVAFDSKVLTKISFEKLRLKIGNFKITRDMFLTNLKNCGRFFFFFLMNL